MRPLLRSVLAGLATGARSTGAVTACALTPAGAHPLDALLHRGRVPRAVCAGAALELAGDKLPVAPARTELPGLAARLVAGGICGGIVAVRGGGPLVAGTAAGGGAALAWTLLGVRYRAALAARCGSDLPGAVLEDAAAAVLAVTAARG